MNFLQSLSAWGGSTALTLIAFLVVLTIVVFIHEMGHFLVGRWCGIRVEAFSIGFGPEIYGWDDRHGTRWKISAIPLGGYVKFFGDADAASKPDFAASNALSEEERKVSFFHKSVGQRAAVVAAGPVANFLLAIALFAGLFMSVGKQIILPRVDDVVAQSAAADAGFKAGDLIRAIDGQPIESFSDMQRIVHVSAGVPLDFEVERDGRRVMLNATPRTKEDKDVFGGTYRIGLIGISRSTSADDITFRRYGPVDAVAMGVKETWFIVVQTGIFLHDVVIGKQSTDQLGGPIKIARVSGHAINLGASALLGLIAVLSVSIGLLNLLPVPVLDGGHLLFYAIEALKGSPLSEKAQDFSFRFGMVLVLMLMVFATWNDIRGLIG